MNLTEKLDKYIKNIKESNTTTYLDTIAKEIKENIEKYFKYKVRIKDLETNYFDGYPTRFIISINSDSFKENTFIEVYVYPQYLDVELSINLPNVGYDRTHDIIKNYRINCSSVSDIKRKLVPQLSKTIISIWSTLIKVPDDFNPETDPEINRVKKIKQDNFNAKVKAWSDALGPVIDKNKPEGKTREEIEKELKWKKQRESREAMPRKVIREMSKINYRIGKFYFICTNRNTCERDMFLKYKTNNGTYPQFVIEFPALNKEIRINGKEVMLNHSPSINKLTVICDDGKPYRNYCSYPDDTPPEEARRISNCTIRPYVETINVPFNNWPLQKLVNRIPKIVKEIVEDFIFNFNEKLINRINTHLLPIKEDGNWKNFMSSFNGHSPFNISTRGGSDMEVSTSGRPYQVIVCNRVAYNMAFNKDIYDPIYPRIIISFPGDWEYRNPRDSKIIKIIKADSPHKIMNIANIPFDPDIDILYRESDPRKKKLHNKIYGQIIPIVQRLIDSDRNFENKQAGVLKLNNPIRNIFRDWELPKYLEEYLITIYSPLEKGLTFEEYIQVLKNIPNNKLSTLGINIMTVDIKSENKSYTVKEIYDILSDAPIYFILGEGEIEDEILEEVQNWDLLTDKQLIEIDKLTEQRIEKLIWENRNKIIQNCKNYIKGEIE